MYDCDQTKKTGEVLISREKSRENILEKASQKVALKIFFILSKIFSIIPIIRSGDVVNALVPSTVTVPSFSELENYIFYLFIFLSYN